MKKKMILFTILIILVIILLICLWGLNYVKTHLGEGKQETDNLILNNMLEIEDSGEKNTVIWYAEKYIELCNNKDDQTLYNILDQEYIDKYNIDFKNIFEFLNEYTSKKIDIEFIKYKNITLTIRNYYIIGKVGDKDIKLLIKFDYDNNAFSVIPCDDMSNNDFLNKTSSEPVEIYSGNGFTFIN